MFTKIAVPVAAFAVTVTAASAFNSDMLANLDIDLTDDQVSALEEAKEIRETAHEEAQAVLEDAGLDEEKMHEIREAMHAERDAHREAVHAAIEANDYEAFLEAVDGGPMSEAIESEADFELLVEAHELRAEGDREGAQEIMSELGIERPEGMGGEGRGHGHGGKRGGFGGERGFGA
jgi:hypothetical protein